MVKCGGKSRSTRAVLHGRGSTDSNLENNVVGDLEPMDDTTLDPLILDNVPTLAVHVASPFSVSGEYTCSKHY